MNLCIAFLLASFKVIAIPAQFQDCRFTSSQKEVKAMLDNTAEYFNEQYGGTRTFEFDLAPVATLPKNLSYYGKNATDAHDKMLYEGVVEACRQAGDSIDFSEYDNDGDGFVDAVIILTAGLSEADGTSEDNIWPQQDRLKNHNAVLQTGGVKVDGYITVNELWSRGGEGARLTGIGNLCHEFCHLLGLPDYYDTDGKSGGLSRAMWGTLALMDEGNLNDEGRTPPYFNALDLELLGLGEAVEMVPGEYLLEPMGKSRKYLKAETGRDGEYFLFEARDNSGRDAFIGGKGLVIYHIDRSDRQMPFWNEDKVNCKAEHQNAYAIPCIPEAESVSRVFFPQAGNDCFASSSTPAFMDWSGKESPFAVTGIKSRADGKVSFSVIRPFTIEDPVVFQDAVMFRWSKDSSLENPSTAVSWSIGGETLGSVITDDGFITVEGLEPYSTYVFTFTDLESGYFATQTVTTKVFRDNAKPYIYLNYAERNADGSFMRGTRFPLRVINAKNVSSIVWYDGKNRINPDADGYLTLARDMNLKAEITHTDSTREVLMKEIHVK
ncbi:MAG: M6 family metalloprotease domain-containing protein [Bacteroidia bacterium]|nr:M6 family metalloprotease domain-containing protein [Bacteroidia bacterium]